MTPFYLSIIFVGIVLITISLIAILVDKKNSHDYREDLRGSKQELLDIIDDAEQILEELNNISDYIFQKIDEKDKKLDQSIAIADEKLDLLNNIDLSNNDKNNQDDDCLDQIVQDVVDNMPKKSRRNKVIPFNEKRREVMKLKNNGMNPTEIARRLNMGKGEIELISRMCK